MTDDAISDLVARAAAGNAEAFTELVRRHRATVVRWGAALTGDLDDADDVAQTVWIKAYRNLGSYRGESSFSTWLFRITWNTGTEWRRTRQRRSERLAAWQGANPPNAEPPPDAAEVDRRLVDTVRSLLGDLPPRQRMVFVLSDLEGRAPVEIAEMLELSAVTVRANLFKARRAMRARLLQRAPELVREYRS
jgi:RNA polymerase sigma-70 factor, ECF subfamily